MILLETNIGRINPLRGSMIHRPLFYMLVEWCIIGEASVEGSIVASKVARTYCIRRHSAISGRIFGHYTPASVDKNPSPSITADNIMNSIDALVVIFVMEDERLLDFFHGCHILLLYCLGGTELIETTRQSGGHCTLIYLFPNMVSDSCGIFLDFLIVAFEGDQGL